MILIEREGQEVFIGKPTGENELIELLKLKGYNFVLHLENDYLFVLNQFCK